VLVEAACLAMEGEGIELLRPLRDLEPEIDTFAMMPATGLGSVHMDPVEPVPAFIDGYLLADLPPAAIDALVESAGPGSGSPLLSVEVRHLGAALAYDAADHGALPSLDAGFLTATISLVPNRNVAAATEHHAAIVRASLAPWEAERSYPNFAERSPHVPDFHSPATRKRLGIVKAHYDPRDLIRAPHPIASA
jgi:hypothetical protein